MEPLKEQTEPGKYDEQQLTPEEIHQAIYQAAIKCEFLKARAEVRAKLINIEKAKKK